MKDLEQRYRKLAGALGAVSQRLRRLEEPVAIVGMACRLPGGVDSPDAYWHLLDEGRDAVGPLTGRWSEAELGGATAQGAFVAEADRFDAEFFGIAPREARWMDPQQRLALQICYEAIERAGIVPATLRGSRTGVFLGSTGSDYLHGADLDALEGYALTGSASSVLSGRVSYVLGAQGPCFSVDTACSSSLVALHLACTSLRAGESDLALAGGVTVMNTPGALVEFARMGASAADGRCKSFAAEADGAGWAEGGVVLALATVSEATRRGLPILALIRSSAINHDGRSQGLTAPNGPSQQRVIRAALEAARLGPDDIDVIEAHGTGTRLGDAIEAGSLLEVFAPRERPLLLGSSKSNLAHTQAAAGVAGVQKIVLALLRERLPITLHADRPHDAIDWDAGLRLVTRPTPWTRGDRPRRAGVSSFGISGTNAHVIVEEAPAAPPRPHGADPQLLVMSALDEAQLPDVARRYAAALRQHPLADVSWTAAAHRTHHPHRACVVASTSEEAASALDAFARDGRHPAVRVGQAAARPRVVFLFPGQGSQWTGMGRSLLASGGPFRDAFEQADRAIRAESGFSVLDALDSEVRGIERIQPVLFAMALGIAAAWQAAGVEPDLVVGHSQGEIPAAVVSGRLTLEEGARIICRRSRLLTRLVGRGTLALVGLDPDEITRRIGPGAPLCVAAHNGPQATIVAGETAALDGWLLELQAEGVFVRRVDAAVASHSPQSDPLRDELVAALSGLQPREGSVAMMSTVDAAPAGPLGPDYWFRNMREPVRLAPVLEGLWRAGPHVIVEISPHPVLGLAVEAGRVAAAGSGGVVHSLLRDRPERASLLGGIGAAHVLGVEPRWPALLAGAIVPDVPTTPFRGTRFQRPTSPRSTGAPGLEPTRHPLLAAFTPLADGGFLFAGSVAGAGWVAEHVVHGRCILPGMVLVEAALTAAMRAFPGQVPVGHDFVFEAPLEVGEPTTLQLHIGPDKLGRRELTLSSRVRDAWTRHLSGQLTVGAAARPVLSPTPAPADALDGAAIYGAMEATAVRYGPPFRVVERAWGAAGLVQGDLALHPDVATDGFTVHPTLLDGALHLSGLAGHDLDTAQTWVPFGVARAVLWPSASAPSALRARVRLVDNEPGTARRDVLCCSLSGEAVAEIVGLTLRRWDERRAAPLHAVTWSPVTPARTAEPWTVVEPGQFAAALDDPALRRVAVDWPPTRLDADAVRQRAREGLAHLRLWLSHPRGRGVELAWCTRDAASAPLWGLARSTRSEHPDRVLRLARLSADGSVAAALAALQSEPEVRVNGEHALAPRITRLVGAPSGFDPPPGTVLVTGGLAGLGAEVARHWAARFGDRHDLLLLSRRGADTPGADRLVAEIRALGATARTAACDVADYDALAAVLSAVDRPLVGVIHCAGVLDDGLVTALDDERLDLVLRPKVDGTLNLDALTADRALAFFVLFSSTAGLVGSAGQANHAAANVFLDAFAEERRRAGSPAQSLAWGLWAGAGAAAERGPQVVGAHALTIADGLARLDAALDHPDRDLVLTNVVAERKPDTAEGALAAELRGLPAEQARPRLERHLRREIAFALGTDEGTITRERPLRDLGLDSLMALAVRNRLAAGLSTPLPATLLFDAPTLAVLTTDILRRIEQPPTRPAAVPALAAQAPAGRGPLTEGVVRADGIDTAWLAWGDVGRPTFVCVHGHREQALVWAPFAERMTARGWRVVAPDLAGHGRSAALPGRGGYDLAELVRCLDATLRAIVGGPAVLVGHSLGAQLSLLLAAARPERWTGLVLLDPPLVAPEATTDVTALRALLDRSPRPHAVFSSVDEAATLLAASIPNLGDALAQRMAERATRPVEGGVSWRWDPRLHLPMVGRDLIGSPEALLGAVRTLAIFGRDSAYVSPASQSLIARTAPDAEVHVVEGGHWPHLEALNAVERTLARWLSADDAGSELELAMEIA